MGDTLDSIALLRHYRRVLLHPAASAPAPARMAASASESESDDSALQPGRVVASLSATPLPPFQPRIASTAAASEYVSM